MAGQRQPIELIMANGKKHLTKSEIENRKNTEIKAPAEHVVAPDYLDKKQKDKFYQISDDLLKIGIMSDLDCDSLGRYLMAESAYLKITKALKNLSIEDIIIYEKMVNLQDKYFKQCRSIANDLGLSISSRCKLVVPKVEEKPKKNKFIAFTGGVKSG